LPTIFVFVLVFVLVLPPETKTKTKTKTRTRTRTKITNRSVKPRRDEARTLDILRCAEGECVGSSPGVFIS